MDLQSHAMAIDSNGFVSFIEQKIFQIPILFAIIGLAYLRACGNYSYDFVIDDPSIYMGQGILLFKYEIFIHDFVGFYSCLLDPETNSKGRAKWSFLEISNIHSPRLASSSSGLIRFLQP